MQIILGAKEKLGWGCQFEPQSRRTVDSHESARISVNCPSLIAENATKLRMKISIIT